ncbi:adhesion G-protein coupled receptor F3-like isoform X2 [Dendropsophus ebraccatus]|uniref:adhesion G-protein coupled receptor F3-like isoform X2 n=1 Tax=Dendropsophus ebraccatus TaxID=150705 RepID=UPI003831C2D3
MSSVTITDIATTSISDDILQLWAEQASQNQLNSGGLGVLQSLWSYATTSSDGFESSQVPLVLYILGNLTSNMEMADLYFSVDTVNQVLGIANQLLSDMSSDPSLDMEESLGSQLLWCLENLFPLMSTTYEPFSFSYENLDLQYTVTACDSLDNNKIMQVGTTNSTVSLAADYASDCDVSIFSLTCKPQNNTFSSQFDSDGRTSYSYYLASDIQTKVMMLNSKSNHVANVNMSFTCGTRVCDRTATCVYWNFTLNKWSSNGCQTQVKDGMTRCMCDHLTSFAVLMSGVVSDDNLNDAILSYITRVGLCLSSLSLLLCISIQVILLRRSRRDVAVYRHVSILNMSAFLLTFNLSFLACDFVKQDVQVTLCVALTFCSHLSLLGFFCWTLVQSMFLVCRLVFVFHHVTKTEFLVPSIILGYVCPVVIALGTFMAYFPHHYRMNVACWLDRSSGAVMAFNIPAIVTMGLNFLILMVVIHKLLRPSVSEGKSEDEDVVKKLVKAVLFCTPQFGLTWAIGIPLFASPTNLYLQYLFVLLNPLQVMDLVKNSFMQSSATTSTVTTMSG